MNRRNTIIVAITSITVLAVMGVLLYLQSLKTVLFDTKKHDLTIKIEPADATTEVGKLTGSGTLKLQEGKYKAIVQNDLYDTTPIAFEVSGNDTKVTIDPSYSATHLAELLLPEQAAINKALADTYPKIINNFTIRNGELYKDGLWYAGLLVEKTQSRGIESDIYRTVVKKENGKWVVKAKPSLVLSAKEYTDIPFDILSSINSRGLYQ